MDHSLCIAGIDEAGRGALCGPVVAGAVIMTEPVFLRRRSFNCWSPFKKIPATDCLIADSKVLSPEDRDVSYAWITSHCSYGVGIVPAEIIDREGILRATELAMQAALEYLCRDTIPDELLVDGRDAFHFAIPHQSIIRGDGTEACIAAASIIAKVTRDRIMTAEHLRFPHYGFDRHKGYGTDIHRKQILQHGPCPLHRMSFLGRVLSQGI